LEGIGDDGVDREGEERVGGEGRKWKKLRERETEGEERKVEETEGWGERVESCLINCKPKTATTQQLQVFLFTRRAN